jgi:hypothetical protein
MTDREPIEITNLDRYGSAELPWSRPRDLLAASATSNTTFQAASNSTLIQNKEETCQ